MPTETNLPTMVTLYFEVLNKLNDYHSDFDSSSPEHKIFEAEIRYYLNMIRLELNLEKIRKESE
jgi:hypothetical protein